MADPELDGGGGGGTPYIDWQTDLTDALPSSAFSAHTQDPLGGPEQAFDGNPGTNYVSGDYPTSFLWETPGAFIQVQFPTPVRVAGLTMQACFNEGPPSYCQDGMPAVFELQYSDDGQTWHGVQLWDYVHPTYLPYEQGSAKGYGLPRALVPATSHAYWRIKVWRVYGRIHQDDYNPTVVINDIQLHPFIGQ